MEIGEKLRNCRNRAGITQDDCAEKLGVSRQTVSNWETGRSYPDVRSCLALGDLYQVTLDELLKEDAGMIAHLEKSTDVVESKRKNRKLIEVLTYLGIWAVSILFFWAGGGTDAMGYSLLVLYLILPAATAVISFLIGKDDGWAGSKWLMMLFFGFFYFLASYATFDLSNMIAFRHFNPPELSQILPGILISAAGIAAGSLARRIAAKRKKAMEGAGEAK